VRDCLFEVQESSRPKTAEDERGGTTVVTNETAWVFMPANGDGLMPAFDRDGRQCAGPIDSVTVTSSKVIRYAGHDYQMRGEAVLEIDINGRPDHVFALCERQLG
jgi:hypothetical protein